MSELQLLAQILFEHSTENFEIFKENDAIKRNFHSFHFDVEFEP